VDEVEGQAVVATKAIGDVGELQTIQEAVGPLTNPSATLQK